MPEEVEHRSGGGGTAPHDGPSPAQFAGGGLQFALSILLFLYLGRWLDGKLGTSPWLLIVGVMIGAAAGFYSFYRKVMDAQRRDGGEARR